MILKEAQELVDGERQEQYGDPVEHYKRLAKAMSLVLNTPVSPEQAALCQIALKMVREAHRPKYDNRLDMAGGIEILDRIVQNKEK